MKLKRVSKWSVVLVVFLATIGGATWQGWKWWTESNSPVISSPLTTQKPLRLQIRPGTSAQEIGRDLQALGLIRSATAWDVWVRWLRLREPQGGFKAGTYQLSATESMQTIASRIWGGDTVQLSFTIPEGWSLAQMAAYFQQQGYFSASDFLKAAEEFSLTPYPWMPADLPKTAARLEGYLYPDTYQIAAGVTPKDILKQMLDRFEQVALPIYQQQQGRSSLSLNQWVTLSSIVEKEAVVASERATIAGVFLNRLKKDMTLGADPTVEYGLGIQQTPDKPLTLQDVRTPTPYNTYINPGLPPTPIASPSVASLKAVLSPETTDYLYFVARYDGTHVFSRTLAEHEAAQTSIHDRRDAQNKPKK
jgi:UPF0755 protein